MIVEHGPSLGEHHGKPIPSYIVDENGTRLEFDRIAVETDGGVELSQLSDNEVVIAPGLIYRHRNCRSLEASGLPRERLAPKCPMPRYVESVKRCGDR